MVRRKSKGARAAIDEGRGKIPTLVSTQEQVRKRPTLFSPPTYVD